MSVHLIIPLHEYIQLNNSGEAYVIFQNEAEAEKAKESRNKQTIMSRWIDLFQVSVIHICIAGSGNITDECVFS